MAVKLIFSTVAVTALMSATALAQVETTETDPRFMPRIYGSTAVTGVDYGQGATTIAAPVQSIETYEMSPSTTYRVVEPVAQDIQSVISAPITYSDTGVVKAQHFKQGDLSPAEYQALLEEADRVRAYQITNENYTGISYAATQGAVTTSPVDSSYEIELFAEPVSSVPSMTYDEAASSISAPVAVAHTVIKGDTLYNISKRYAVTVSELKAANSLSNADIKLGQTLSIPSATTMISENTWVQPVTMASTSTPLTFAGNAQPIVGQASGIYAVLPKDTLYSISRRACVKVADLISVNGISNPNSLQPGQRLTMPQGHCLN